MKILIIGFGSIGARHFRNLRNLGYRNVWVYDRDWFKTNDLNLRLRSLNSRTLRGFDAVFICTPNHLHMKFALLAARAGCDLFIEKPLSHNLENVAKLKSIVKNKGLVSMVACNMRFHPAMVFLKNYLQKKKLGKVYSIYHEFGYDLASWSTTGRDYRKTYSASKKMGGGIRLDDIHEFDLLMWLNDFSEVKKSAILFDKVSDLRIDTEDIAIGAYQFKNGTFGLVKSDYLQKAYTRHCQIVGSKGTLEWDWNENTVWLRTRDREEVLKKFGRYDRNQMYLDEVKYFLSKVAVRKGTFNDIERASEVLKTVLQP